MRKKISILLIFISCLILIYPAIGGNIFKNQQNKKIEDFKEKIIEIDDEDIKYLDNIGEMLGFIKIDKINLYLPIYEGTDDKVLLNGVGHIGDTSLPKQNDNYHSFFAGHTGIMAKNLFDDLPKLEMGDKFQITIYEQDFYYEICDIQKVSRDDIDKIKFDDDGEYVTLVTCTPKYINSHRLLVTGKYV